MIHDGILYVDNTILSAVAQCDTKALFTYGFGLRPTEEDKSALQAGTACHSALECQWKGGTIDEALAVFDTDYKQFCIDSPPLWERLSFVNVRRIIEHVMYTRPPSMMPFEVIPKFVETSFAVNLTENIVLVGRLDAIVRMDDYYVLDHKTTGKIDSTKVKRWKISSQLKGYTWAVRQQLDLPVRGAFINVIGIKEVPSSDRICKEHGGKYENCGLLHIKAETLGPIEFTEQQLGDWRRTAISYANRYRKLLTDFPKVEHIVGAETTGMFTDGCTFCGAWDWCMAGRPPRLIPSMFKYDPWEPWKEVIDNIEREKLNTSESKASK